MRLTLPWPPTGLRPNARLGWRAKGKLAAQYRIDCWWASKASGGRILHEHQGPLAVAITFQPPNANRRDLDGALSSIKQGLDAVAEIVGVDDHHFALTLRMGDPVKHGAVVVEIAP